MAFNLGVDYRRYQRYFVNLQALYQKKEARVYTGLILSLFAIAFFGFFALKPTFTTIASLIRELQDKKEINQKLQEKINNLRQAQVNYSPVANSVFLVDQALPQSPSVSQIVYQIEILAQKSNLTLRSLTFEPIDLQEKSPNQKNEIRFNLTLGGDFENLKAFLGSLESLRRIIIINSFSLAQIQTQEVQTMVLNLSGKAYYLPKEAK